MKIAVHGLGRMGMNIAQKLVASGEHDVIAHNRSIEPIEEAAAAGAIPAATKDDVCAAFGTERPLVWLMLPAEVTDDEIAEWSNVLPRGSIIINGGNSDYRRTIVMNKVVNAAGSHLVDIGVSGGLQGAKNGYPLMCGCDQKEIYDDIRTILDILVKPNGMHAYFGTSGAGHYVKMVHNAVEYGMMQSLGEGYQLLREGPYPDTDLEDVTSLWQHGSIVESRLNELSRDIFHDNPSLGGVSGYVAESGEARWAIETAHSLGITLPCIESAFQARIDTQSGKTSFATKTVAAQRNRFGGHNINGEGAA